MNKFKNNSLYSNQNGYASIIIIIVVLVAVFWFLFFPKVTPFTGEEADSVTATTFCGLDNEANAPTITTYGYRIEQNGCPDDPGGDCSETIILDGSNPRYRQPQTVTYKRIKKNVPIWERWFTGYSCSHPDDTRENDPDNVCQNNEDLHFRQSNLQPTASVNGQTYRVYYPAPELGKSYPFGNVNQYITFDTYKLLYLVHPNPVIEASELVGAPRRDEPPQIFENIVLWNTDIYQQVGAPSLPSYILDCATSETLPDNVTPQITVTEPEQNKSVDKNQLQLEYFLFNKDTPVATSSGWWTPECKPAIYLYPEEETQVHVKVHPKGFLTYTDPLYPQDGWVTTAFPDGRLFYEGKEYPYLYYESKILDRYVTKPTEGYVVSYGQLSTLYESLLPQLGLNEQETKDFKDYWQKYLPYAPYYFVGVMSEESIEEIEPLTITPSPATVIRVRTYFEALNQVKSVKAPILEKKIRDGFTVVEWGGMVKVDKNHPFTCSQ